MSSDMLETLGESEVSLKIHGTNETLEASGVIDKIQDILGDDFEKIIVSENVYLSTALYLVYWYSRTKNNVKNNREAKRNAYAYFGENNVAQVNKLLESESLIDLAQQHVESNVLMMPTIDVVVENANKEILTSERMFFPEGEALIGGLILDEDEDNILGVGAPVFAALRVAAEKILGRENFEYGEARDEKGSYVFVKKQDQNGANIRLYEQEKKGYKYKDNVTSMVKASDPRHMVDTTAYRMELHGEVEIEKGLGWTSIQSITDLSNEKGGLAFGHHRQIVDAVTREKTEIEIDMISHHNWVRDIIQNPLENHNQIKNRFEENGNHAETPCPELLPVVKKMMTDLYSNELNDFCATQSFALGQRQLIMNDLMHCASESDKICPYSSTLRVIIEAIGFFDVYERIKKGFYEEWTSDGFVEQDPRLQKYAYFFRTKYKNHLDALLASFPEEIIIPTYEHLGATDIMKVRGIPLRFVGLSNKFLYVDEFFQSPIEFLLHDGDHSLRMAYEDKKYCEEKGITRDELISRSIKFSSSYLKSIAIVRGDSEKEKEIKKLKKILCFEVTHEDSKPFMRDVIIEALQTEEGADIHRESLEINTKTGMFERVRTIESQGGVSPLAFALHKLQHGFFDEVDNQISQIVDPRYRTAEFVAEAAYEILADLDAEALPGVPTDERGNVSYEWILKRTCSKSPRKVHHTEFRDPAISEYGDGTKS